ncbi:MAG: hypothetical protein AAF492_04870, partial [Verrucomicrobiota bacterium]
HFKWILGVSAVCAVSASTHAGLKVQSVLQEDILKPESAYYDDESGFVFLSQIRDGKGTQKDGDGRISKLSADGKTVIKNDWVTGLNAPKGLRSHQGTLWVTDIDRFVAIDIAKGAIRDVIDVPGAQFLNDIACGSDGTVYISDMTAGRIHQYKDGTLSVFLEGPTVESPNGLLVHKNKLLVGGWGLEIQSDFTTKTPGRLLAINLKTKKVKPITKKPLGNLDGVELDGKGGYIVTDWIAGKVFHITKKGETEMIQKMPKGSADHAYIVKSGLLIVPEMLENKVTVFHLEK